LKAVNMKLMEYFKSLKSPEHRLAWAVAMAADAIQIAALPFFVEGGLSPADSLLDLIVGLRPDPPAGMALGLLADAGSGVDPGRGSVPDVDGGGVVRDSATGALRGTGDPAAGAGAGSAEIG
jgi:hypothetical protein